MRASGKRMYCSDVSIGFLREGNGERSARPAYDDGVLTRDELELSYQIGRNADVELVAKANELPKWRRLVLSHVA
jgi:hypothetical protein